MREDSAEGIVLAQLDAPLRFIQQGVADLGPIAPQNIGPLFMQAGRALPAPALIDGAGLPDPGLDVGGVQLVDDGFCQGQAALIDLMVRLHPATHARPCKDPKQQRKISLTIRITIRIRMGTVAESAMRRPYVGSSEGEEWGLGEAEGVDPVAEVFGEGGGDG
jgi:hypothetical protein